MKLIGRKASKDTMKNCLESTKSSLVAVYGRRRIGKTYLIRQYFADNMVFDITGLHNGTMKDQLFHFRNTLAKAGYKDAIEPPKTWLSAFYMLENFVDTLKTDKKKVIFLDEMPWMDTPRSKFLMAFENFWNAWCTNRNDLIVVICGSAASWMIKKILHNNGGLYNRVTHKIRLQPFTLHETELFLASKGIVWSRYDIVQSYMIMGGVPFYLEQIRKGESVMQFVDRTCFTEEGMLMNEYEELFASLFANSDRHYKIVETLATIRKGLVRDELLQKSGMETGGSFTETLDELLASGFVERQSPFKKEKQGTLYRLADPFMIFYNQFMKGRSRKGTNSWVQISGTPTWNAWAGLAFENVCMHHVLQVKEALKLTAISTEESAWRGGDSEGQAQIDLLIERADRLIHVCEIKFSKGIFSIDKNYASELRQKLFIFGQQPTNKRMTLFLTMISTFGIQPNEYSHELVQNELTLEDLFVG